jgi:lysophospholipase L1-like esterase
MHRVGRDGFRSLLTFRYGFLPWNYAKIKDYDFIIMSFGEIDAREHVEKISEKTAKPIEEIVNTLVENFMESLACFFDGKAKILISCVHPTPPGNDTGQLFIRDTLNQKMKSCCARYNFQFLDFRDQCQTNGWLDNRYAGDGVHLDPRNTEFVKDAILAKLGINLAYAPDYKDLYLRPVSAKTLRARYNRTRKKLFRRN